MDVDIVPIDGDFLPAPGFLQGVDHLARHVALVMFGKHCVGGENAAGLELALRYHPLPFPKQIGHDTLKVYGHVDLAISHGEAHLQIVAALNTARFHQPTNAHTRAWRNALFSEVGR